MAELSTIARPYAEAIFHFACEGNTETWLQRLDLFASVAQAPAASAVLSDPKITVQQLLDMVRGVVNGFLYNEEEQFVRLLLENDRFGVLPEIAKQFRVLKNTREGAADAEIVSAFPLEATQLSDLVASLEKKFAVKLRPTVTVDASLIGGVKVTVGDQVMDTSVRSRLAQMHTALTA